MICEEIEVIRKSPVKSCAKGRWEKVLKKAVEHVFSAAAFKRCSGERWRKKAPRGYLGQV